MKLLIDPAIVRGIVKENLSVELSQSDEIMLGWPGLLEFLEIEIARSFPSFTKDDPLYQEIIIALEAKPHPEHLEHLFDQVFVKCLNWVRSKQEIHPTFLAHAIRERKSSQLFSKPIDHYERLFLEHPYHTIHDLTLYLGWDRVCVDMAVLFEYQSTSDHVKQGLSLLRSCLIESFQHITAQKKTIPGFFRLAEALYAFQMREESLQTYSDAAWQTLCESAQALRPRDQFLEVPYIDQALFDTKNSAHLPLSAKALTLDSWDKVNKSLGLARYMIDTLKNEDVDWHYDLQAMEVSSLS